MGNPTSIILSWWTRMEYHHRRELGLASSNTEGNWESKINFSGAPLWEAMLRIGRLTESNRKECMPMSNSLSRSKILVNATPIWLKLGFSPTHIPIVNARWSSKNDGLNQFVCITCQTNSPVSSIWGPVIFHAITDSHQFLRICTLVQIDPNIYTEPWSLQKNRQSFGSAVLCLFRKLTSMVASASDRGLKLTCVISLTGTNRTSKMIVSQLEFSLRFSRFSGLSQ